MIELKNITEQIRFDESAHTYTRVSDGKVLSGVTSMMRNMGLSANYDGVPQDILDKAAERGTTIHKQCEIADMFDAPTGDVYADAYLSLRKSRNLIPVANEYLISDMDNFASCIDIVLTSEEMMKNNEVVLADIKTTSSIHNDTLSWQLSIYKEMFIKQNPGIKVVGLYGIWLPKEQYGKPSMFEVKEKDCGEVSRLLDCAASGQPFVSEIAEYTLPANISANLQEYLEAKARMKADADIVKRFEEEILKSFVDNDVKKWEFENAIFTRVLPQTKESFDSKAFKSDNPELYAKYIKQSTTKNSLRITIK